MKDRPTERQMTILRYIANYTLDKGFPPSIREICDSHGITSLRGATVNLDALERKGLISRQFQQARGIKVTPAGREAIGIPSLKPETADGWHQMCLDLAHAFETVVCSADANLAFLLEHGRGAQLEKAIGRYRALQSRLEGPEFAEERSEE